MNIKNILNNNLDLLTIILPTILFIFFWDVRPTCYPIILHDGSDISSCINKLENFKISSLINFEYSQLRFLIVIPFIRLLLTIKKKDLIKSLIVPFIIIIHLIAIKIIFNYEFVKRDFLTMLYFIVVFAVSYNYREKIVTNFHNILKLFIFIFVILFSFYFFLFKAEFILNCYNGWFSQTRFIFKENSHFSIMAVPIITYYNLYFLKLKKFNKISPILLKDSSNHKLNFSYFESIIYFCKNSIKFEIIIYLLFLIYSYLNFSTTFLVGILITQCMVIFFYLFIFKSENKFKILLSSIIFITLSLSILYTKDQCRYRSFDAISKIDIDVKKIFKIFEFKKKQVTTVKKEALKKEEEIIYKNTELKTLSKKHKTSPSKPTGYSYSVQVIITSFKVTYKSITNNPFGFGFNNFQTAHKIYVEDIIDGLILAHPDTKGVSSTLRNVNKYDGGSTFNKIIVEFGIFGLFLIILLVYYTFKKIKDDPIFFFFLPVIILQLLRGVGYLNGGFLLCVIITFYLFTDFYKKKLI